MLNEKVDDLHPKHEPIVMARKPLEEKTVAENVLKHGTGGINIDECRVGTDEKLTRDIHTFGYQKNGVSYDYKKVTTQGSTQGRFPANLIHDGSDEVVSGFPETKS
jgi:site-specific DNA-methyltransferase (adenine-specific)